MRWKRYLLVLVLLSALIGGISYFKAASGEPLNVTIEVKIAQCSDGIDNDGDFLIDLDDPQCFSSSDDNENVDGVETHTTNTITTSGGSHSFDNQDGLAVDFTFPANFRATSTRLFANSYSNSFFDSEKPAPSGKSFIGKTYEFILFDTVSFNTVTTTDESVTIVLRYSDSDISGIDETSLGPYRHNGTSWQLISGGTIDAANNKLTFSTKDFSPFAIFGEAPTEEEPAPAPVSSGGGGSLRTVTETATVILKGRAYPKSAVTVQTNGKTLDTVIADENAVWTKQFIISPGAYVFSIYSSDSRGRRSLTYTFSLNAAAGTVSTVSGIFIAPTIDTDKSQVRKGENINIFGQTTPGATVSVFIASEHEIVEEMPVDQNGTYFLAFNSGLLEYGDHTVKSRSLIENNISALSQVINFRVGTRNILKKLLGDLNGDGRVNIIDFSILLFYWNSRTEIALQKADINSDNIVNLRDLSIMLFYWTG